MKNENRVTMSKQIKFIYKEEYWFISAFVNTVKVDILEIAQRLENAIKKRISTISKKDAYREEFADDLIQMAKNVSLKCNWIESFDNFPYYNENTNDFYNSLGYFYFEVEYYKDNPAKKKDIKPTLLQQIPFLIKNEIQKEQIFSQEQIYFDIESPIFVFATSNKTDPRDIEWTDEEVFAHDKDLSYWTVLYSGQWEDYSPSLYRERVQNNLSNRLSELHYINRNSGFVYMAEENYERFFNSYMKTNVLEPTARIRTIMFSLREINNSLDYLFLNTHREGLQDIEILEEKLKNLRFLRGILQNTLSMIYNELDYNRRQHYTTVLKHLITKFDLTSVKERVNEKFSLIYDTMREVYQRRSDQDQEKTEKALNILNFLLGAGILADLAELLMISFSLGEGDIPAVILNGTFAIIISSVLVIALIYYALVKYDIKKENIRKTVDGVILDRRGNILLIKRKYPPFQDFFALPGGFINKGETPKEAIIREIKEETNMEIKIIKKIGVFDEPGRDPRGEVHSTAFLCEITGDPSKARGDTDSKEALYLPIKELHKTKLAFDHRKILQEAGLIEKESFFDKAFS
ncbi:MAG: ADP-ribose pyrophosphatase (modular protein) [Promethearchaeota archaeon]|nr:MAG: ADP-ribose pyrophosphatase (modular protein) [Candidatus Lokiarchaeota archaeon]